MRQRPTRASRQLVETTGSASLRPLKRAVRSSWSRGAPSGRRRSRSAGSPVMWASCTATARRSAVSGEASTWMRPRRSWAISASVSWTPGERSTSWPPFLIWMRESWSCSSGVAWFSSFSPTSRSMVTRAMKTTAIRRMVLGRTQSATIAEDLSQHCHLRVKDIMSAPADGFQGLAAVTPPGDVPIPGAGARPRRARRSRLSGSSRRSSGCPAPCRRPRRRRG